MNHFEEGWKRLVGIEGGYSNNPDDSGGQTMYGVTEKLARGFGYGGKMKDLPIQTARRIAKAAFWDVMKLDDVAEIAPLTAYEMLDSGYLVGPRHPQQWMQRSLNVANLKGEYYDDIKADGYVGPNTIRALTAFIKKRGEEGDRVLAASCNCFLGTHLTVLAERREKDETFWYGWMRQRVL